MFLSSSFNDVYQFLENFYGESVKGKTVAFIDTASLVEDYTKYVDDDRKAFIDLGIIIKDLDIIGKHQNEISKVFFRIRYDFCFRRKHILFTSRIKKI